MINYFIVQEVLGLFFLVFGGTFLQLLVLMIKLGVSPFHFWIFSVVYNLDNFILVWFLTFQKLPFIPIVVSLFYYFLIFFLLIGLIFCYFQIYILKNFKLMFLISSTESFNWILFGILFGLFSYFFILIYYFFNMFILISYLNGTGLRVLGLETIYVFLNIPLSVNFFIKLYILFSTFLVFDFYMVFVLFIIFMSSLCFIGWLVFYRVGFFDSYKDYFKNYNFFVYYFFFIFFFLSF